MSKTKKSSSVRRVGASINRVRREGAQVVERLRTDATKLVAHGRAEVLRDVRAIGKELRDRADRAVHDLERKVVRQFHAATQEQMRRLERRIVKLEQRVAAMTAKPPMVASNDKAA